MYLGNWAEDDDSEDEDSDEDKEIGISEQETHI